MSEEFKRYDSQHSYTIHNARLAKDPQTIEGGERPLVKLTFVATSRSDRHSDMWFEAAVTDRQSDLAGFLKKGDTLGITGFPALRRWGDNNDKFSLELVRADLAPSIELFGKLKERGFSPGAKAKANVPKKAPKGRKVVDLDDDE